MQRAPAFVQGIARTAIEEEARRRKEPVVTPAAVEAVMGSIASGAALSASPQAERSVEPLHGLTMLWEAAAEERLRRIPIPAVRGMVIRKVEAQARAQGLSAVDLAAYEAASPGSFPPSRSADVPLNP
ncbi:MAG: hypothetical protein A3G97_08085 [Candidatus Rokubacteria bacterium RIFCSPLOWO2_12_FULL_69_21]|nr:MAG: hypothetical protein A3G97_08085 [Candidatus Rokubacteria bacterium RIFCSPLOWO2_12_FULL_69_21]